MWMRVTILWECKKQNVGLECCSNGVLGFFDHYSNTPALQYSIGKRCLWQSKKLPHNRRMTRCNQMKSSTSTCALKESLRRVILRAPSIFPSLFPIQREGWS